REESMRLVAAEHVEAERARARRVDDDVDGTADLDPSRADGETEKVGEASAHIRIVFLSARPETAFAARLLQLDPHVVDARAGGAAAAPGYQCVDCVRRTLEDRFDRAVGVVPHPAGHAARPCTRARRVPKADTLHVPRDGDVRA